MREAGYQVDEAVGRLAHGHIPAVFAVSLTESEVAAIGRHARLAQTIIGDKLYVRPGLAIVFGNSGEEPSHLSFGAGFVFYNDSPVGKGGKEDGAFF